MNMKGKGKNDLTPVSTLKSRDTEEAGIIDNKIVRNWHASNYNKCE